VVGGASTGQGKPDTTLRYWISAAIGALFLVVAAAQLIKARTPSGPPKWIAVLEGCSPRIALIAGSGLALVNPNLVILLSGLSAVGASGVGPGQALLAVLVLLLFCSLDLVLPLGAYLIFGDRARRALEVSKVWMLEHNTALSVGVLLVFGLVFVVRGISGITAA
jgi:hypothetical protein